MKPEEFRNIFEGVKYTEEFKQKMREKLSEKNTSSADEYSQKVEGVEIKQRSRIVQITGAVAAGLAVVVGTAAIGFTMKGAFKQDENPLSSIPENVEATSIPLVEATTEIVTESVTTPTLDMLIDKNIPYAGLSEKSREELYEIGMKYYSAACELYLMNMGASIALNCDYDNGINAENNLYYDLVQCEGLNSISDAEALYHSVFSGTWEFEEDFFREQDGRLYYYGLMAAPSNTYYEGWGLSLLEATDEKITYRVDAFFNDGAAGSNVSGVPLEFSLIPEDGVWKVYSFIYPVEAPFDVPVVNSINGSSSDGEIISYARTFLTDAECYTYAFGSPYIGDTHFYESAGAADVMGKGWAIYGEDNADEYWLLTNGKTKQDLYDEIYRYFTEDYETDFDEIVIERDGKTYVQIQPIDIELFHDYTAMRDEITVKSKSDTEIVLEIHSDCTEFVFNFYANGVGLEKLPNDYKYTYPQEVVLVNTEDGWRISQYVPHAVHAMESLYYCPEMQEYIDDIDFQKAEEPTDDPVEAFFKDIPVKFIGEWTNENGDKLTVHDMNDETIEFTVEYKGVGSVTASAVMGDLVDAPGISYFNTMDDDSQIGIEGNIYYHYNDANENSLMMFHWTEHENIPTYVTFDIKVK